MLGGQPPCPPASPTLMTPKSQPPAYPVLHPTTCQVPPQHPLHTPEPGSPQSPPPTRNGVWSTAPPTPLGAPNPRLPVGAPVPCSGSAESARPQPEPPYGPQGPRPPLARSRWVLESTAATPHPRGSSPSPTPLGLGPGLDLVLAQPVGRSPPLTEGVQRSRREMQPLLAACYLSHLPSFPLRPALFSPGTADDLRADETQGIPKSYFTMTQCSLI